MDQNLLIKEIYGKSSNGDFYAKGICKALFRGKEYLDNDLDHLKSIIGKNNIRVFDVVLYQDIVVKNSTLVHDWENEVLKISSLHRVNVNFQSDVAIYFKTLEWENVDFIRIEVDTGILINPNIV